MPALAVLLAACGERAPDVAEPETPETPPDPRTVMVHLFEWPWNDVAAECESWLGPNGFAAVQVSPPQEHHTGPEWWVRYQPVSYRLESRGGSRDAFIDMVSRCKTVGVDIYVDAVINHMTGVRDSGTGSAGTEYGRYDYPPLYGYDDFNHCGVTDGDDIEDFNDVFQLQYCELVNLADLATGTEKVQKRIADYLNELLGLGVAGFRIDAAKHMPVDDLDAILSRVGPEYFVFHEVLSVDSSVVSREAYAELGAVTEFLYESRLADAFRDGDLERLVTLGEASGMLPSDVAVVFVDNHDSQRGGHVLTYKEAKRYRLANVFMLAHPYGYPKLMSSFDFTQRDTGPPATPVLVDGGCSDGWVCEHRWPAITAMVGFRNATYGLDVNNMAMPAPATLSFGRGDRGHVVLNAGDDTLQLDVETSLPDGDFCDILTSCEALTISVSGGRFSVSVPSTTAVVLLADHDR
jgi:alpha-amylase